MAAVGFNPSLTLVSETWGSAVGIVEGQGRFGRNGVQGHSACKFEAAAMLAPGCVCGHLCYLCVLSVLTCLLSAA